MEYSGHIENGKVVFDEQVALPNGLRVVIAVHEGATKSVETRSLRGTPYRLDEPFEPAVPEEDWDVIR